MDRRDETVPLRVQESLTWRFKTTDALGYYSVQLDARPSPTLRVHAPEGI